MRQTNALSSALWMGMVISMASVASATPRVLRVPTTESARPTPNPADGPDPFQSPFDRLADLSRTHPRHPLAAFELDQLKLVGVVASTASPLAMVEDPSGNGHVIRVGSLLTVNDVEVVAIHRDGVTLRRYLRRWDGTVVPELVGWKLRG